MSKLHLLVTCAVVFGSGAAFAATPPLSASATPLPAKPASPPLPPKKSSNATAVTPAGAKSETPARSPARAGAGQVVKTQSGGAPVTTNKLVMTNKSALSAKVAVNPIPVVTLTLSPMIVTPSPTNPLPPAPVSVPAATTIPAGVVSTGYRGPEMVQAVLVALPNGREQPVPVPAGSNISTAAQLNSYLTQTYSNYTPQQLKTALKAVSPSDPSLPIIKNLLAASDYANAAGRDLTGLSASQLQTDLPAITDPVGKAVAQQVLISKYQTAYTNAGLTALSAADLAASGVDPTTHQPLTSEQKAALQKVGGGNTVRNYNRRPGRL